MKKIITIILLLSALIISCASGGSSTGGRNMPNFSDVADREWRLVEAYIDGVDMRFRRENQPEMFREIYILKFEGQFASGIGAPNLYSAPFTLGEDLAISIMPMRSTLMASLFEPENLSEQDFFTFLQNVYTWDLVRNNLILNARTRDNKQVRLVFGQ